MARVLIVLDGKYRFSAAGGTPDFTYTVLLDALLGAGHQVTKAHRESDASPNTMQPFNFATSANLLDFDVIWLIGNKGRNELSSMPIENSEPGIGDAEIAAIARFMAVGGGVFATGDHDSIGAEMCGHIPRVRAMRSWYGKDDSASPMPTDFPRNFPAITAERADTTRRNPASDYGGDTSFVWFENQSDSVPQPITPTTSPAHPILRRDGADIVVYPDHMHEGNTLGEVPGYDYTQSLTFDGESFVEFPAIAGEDRELPKVIATGESVPYASRYVESGEFVGENGETSGPKTISTLSVYDGRVSGVGRIVTGATFHHYVDINLTGDSGVDTPAELAKTGPDAAKGHGFGHPGAEATFAAIKAVFANITDWLARPRPATRLILERSTFSQDEATAEPAFEGAILVIVDGLKPSQFPGGGITHLSPSQTDLETWAPAVTPADPSGLAIEPTGLASDDPMLPDRLQRFTFTYRLRFTNVGTAFGFPGNSRTIQINAELASAAVAAPLTDGAWIQLVKSANPFMLDLANDNTTAWLSSDVRIFPVVADATKFGVHLPADASRAQALTFLRDLVAGMSVAKFESLPMGQEASALSAFPTTTDGKQVYNFAVARVRLSGAGASADDVRVFFRIVPAPTTAALTYQDSAGVPIGSYKKTPGTNPIALPGVNGAGSEWLSFPVFSAARTASPETQTDGDNVKDAAPGSSTFFGALIDNNLNDPYLPPTPMGGVAVDLPALMMGEHQCIVAQVEFPGTPIPSGANPLTSDKLAQRNIALSSIANPGLDASRMALHTFEIEATPHPISDSLPPDELLLDWRKGAPDGTQVRIVIPGWHASEVVALADRFYPRHEIRALDAQTIAVPGGGTRYVPIPPSVRRQTGVLIADLPPGVQKGQRFDLAVRQVTNRGRQVKVERPKVKTISKEEAARLLQSGDTLPLGVFALGNNRSLVTDLRVFDAAGDHAIIIEHQPPVPAAVAAASSRAASWRETIGAFQLGIPVLAKADMLAHHLRLLSVLRWRAERLSWKNRWYDSFIRYVELIALKVRALGGDPFAVPATPDGVIPLPGTGGDHGGAGGAPGGDSGVPAGDPLDPFFEPKADDWLSETTGLPPPGPAKAGIWSGKVSGLLFDHFGDFEGFTLEAYDGTHRRFFSRETAVLDLARAAWTERHVVSVITVSGQSRRVRRLLIRGYAD